MTKYAPIAESQEHIDRHFSDSLVPGSKFLPMDEEERENVIDTVDTQLSIRFQDFLDAGEEPSRIVLQINFSENIGTDALVRFSSEQQDQLIKTIRDAGTENETKVKLLESADIPKTNVMTVIAGPYGPTGKWGIYTMFPGREAPPFPNPDRQNAEDLAANTQFWEEHAFLATREEIQASLPHEVQSQPKVEDKINTAP